MAKKDEKPKGKEMKGDKKDKKGGKKKDCK